MKKKYTIAKFVIIAILCAIATFFTLCSFSVGDSDFVGFARAVNLGIEFKGGTVKEYSVTNNNIESKDISAGIESNATRIKYLLDSNGYTTGTYKNGGNIVVEFYGDEDPVDVTSIISGEISFGIKTSQDATAENVLDANDVKDSYATVVREQNVVYIVFTDEGVTKFQNALASNTLYVYINSSYIYDITSENIQTYALTGFVAPTLDSAKSYASTIMSSKYDFTFEEVSSTVYDAKTASKNTVLLISAVVGVFVLCSAILIGLFKKLGLVGALMLLISLLLQIIILTLIPETVFTLTSAALFAGLLSMVLGALSLYLFFDKMHREYKMGKVLYASVKFGYNKIWATILDMFVVLLATTVVTYFAGTYLVKQFAMSLIVGLIIYGTITVVLTKFFTKWLTYISVKNKDYGFKREAHVDELK